MGYKFHCLKESMLIRLDLYERVIAQIKLVRYGTKTIIELALEEVDIFTNSPSELMENISFLQKIPIAGQLCILIEQMII